MRAVAVLIALTVSTFAYVTTETLPIGLLPLIAGDLGTTTSAVGLLVTAYGLVVVVASIPLTRLTQRLPRRWLLSALLAVLVAGTTVSALADGYRTLLVARIVTALSQAVFWSVVTPATAALFRPERRARVISILFAGSSIAALAGVPAGTWLGQQAGWRSAFLALAGLSALVVVTVAVLMPSIPAGQSETDHGWAPDGGRYWILVVCTALAVTGAFTAFTYVSPYLTDVSGFGASAVGPILFARGLAGLAGVFVAGWLVGRGGWLTMAVLVGLQVVALGGQWLAGGAAVASVVSIAVSGFTLAAFSSALGTRVLEVAPRSSDMAAAGTSTAFNVGITAGAFLGSVLLPAFGLRSTAAAGAAITLAALVVILIEPLVATHRPASPAGSGLDRAAVIQPERSS